MEPREYETLFRVEEKHWWYRALHKNILHSLNKNAHVLDAGCGTGLLLQKLQKEGQAIGIDFSENAVKFCHQRGLQRVARASVERLPFPASTFTAIASADVLYHKGVANDQQALREFHRVLTPDGIIILNLPAFEFLRSSHDRAIHTERRYTKTKLRSMVESAGFKIQKLYYRNTLLFPLVALIRVLRKDRLEPASDVVMPSRIANEFLGGILFFDDWLARKIPIPFGVSVFCVARKA